MPFEDWRSAPRFHVIYFDAFAPNAQPRLWEAPLLQSMYESLLPGGLLTTYCAKGAFKRTLRSIGFTVEALPGPPGKREMTRARKT
jgi:tRNA U34 5-methylaminomethyl-2-thiouridine-forming methyltransferase MnmC